MYLIQAKRADQLNPNDYLLTIQPRGDGLQVERKRIVDMQMLRDRVRLARVRLALGHGHGQTELELECDELVVVLGRRPT